MNRRSALQAIFWTGGAAAAGAPALAVERPANYDASKELARADWKPVFLDDHQDQTLIALSDLIIPSTGTPGAKEALVNRFLDALLAKEKEATQREFLADLAFIDAESMRQYGQAFVYLKPETQTEFLYSVAYPHSLSQWGEAVVEHDAYAHFVGLKRWIASAYYNSEAGLRELGWDGTFPHGNYAGCTPGGNAADSHGAHAHTKSAANEGGR